MYAPPSDDDRPSGRHHSSKGASRGRSGTDASKKGEKGSALRRKSSAASARGPVLKRKKSPPSWGIKKDLGMVDRTAAFFVENQISKTISMKPILLLLFLLIDALSNCG